MLINLKNEMINSRMSMQIVNNQPAKINFKGKEDTFSKNKTMLSWLGVMICHLGMQVWLGG